MWSVPDLSRFAALAVVLVLPLTGFAPVDDGGPASREPALQDAASVAEVAIDVQGDLEQSGTPSGETAVEAVADLAPATDGLAPSVDDGDAVVATLEDAGVATTPAMETDGFSLVGVTWDSAQPDDATEYVVRTRTGDEWTEWFEVPHQAEGADAGQADAAGDDRGGTDPLWVGEAEAVQLGIVGDGAVPEGLAVVLVDPGQGPALTGLSASGGVPGRASGGLAKGAEAGLLLPSTAPQPGILTRAQWGADESLRNVNVGCEPENFPEYADTLRLAVVHHTATTNGYSTVAEAAAQIRAVQQYHVLGRQWCDIGYNFVVDKWGNIYEGRTGGITQPVKGVHSGGFNTGSVGVAMLGTNTSSAPTAQLDAVTRVIAWRLGAYHRDPNGRVTIVTPGGENSKYAPWSVVSLPVVIGHRDVGNTACPGEAAYVNLTGIRAGATALIGTSFIDPAVSPSSVAYGGAVHLSAGVRGSVSYTWTLENGLTGAPLGSGSGTATDGAFGFDIRELSPGVVLPAGHYAVRLTGIDTRTGQAVLTAAPTFSIAPVGNPPTVAPVALKSDVGFVPITPYRVLDTRITGPQFGPKSRLDVDIDAIPGVPANVAAVAINITTVDSTAMTHVSAWPAGQPKPNSSVLNTDKSRTSAAHAVLGVGGEGKISLYNDAGYTNVVVDVFGYYIQGGGLEYHAMSEPQRLLDTRPGEQMTWGESRTIDVRNVPGVGADVAAVVVNVTSTETAEGGYLAVSPGGVGLPQSSTVNHQPGADVANRATVGVTNGTFDVFLVGGSGDAVIDLVGYYSASDGMLFTPIAPTRVTDTRTTQTPLIAREMRWVYAESTAALPARADAVVAVVTSTEPEGLPTFITVWDGQRGRPLTSDLNAGQRKDRANLAVVTLDPSGNFVMYNNEGALHLVVDIYGYFAD